MLSHKEMKELASHMLKDSHYVSLYLDVDPTNNPKKDELLLHFKNLSKDAFEKLKVEEQHSIQIDIDNIEDYLIHHPKDMKRGIAIFSSQSDDFWRVYHTAMPFTNQLVIEHDPYIKPLAAMTDIYSRYLIIVVRNKRARILMADMGQIEELFIIEIPVPELDSGRDGSTGDMAEIRAQRQKDQVRKRLYKELISVIEKMRRDEDIHRILLIGTDSHRGRFKDALPNELRERVVGEFAVEYNASPNEILKLSMPIMKDVEYKFERKALDELFNTGGGGAGAVLGLSDVLDALQQGNVHKLYVMSNMVEPGMVCNNCGAVTTLRETPCPYCGGEMRKVTYMLDLAIQKAMDQGARIDMLEEAPRLVKTGGIGAKLRY
ncbi:MAG: VLRF1 family aeRF1-type release factor [Candidatus Hatepunaea meridiana]|nr:VLRF1 family aeRF1-type release factor [Candidatus Hatepunaea meridiana]